MNTHARTVFLYLIVSTLITSCSSSGNEPIQGDETQQLVAAARANIVGSWSFIYIDTQCEEQYEFLSDGSFSQSSLDEVLVGRYFIASFESDMTELTLQPTQDNLGTDCLGRTEDSTARDFNFLVSFPTNDVMEWAPTSNPELIVASLDRR